MRKIGAVILVFYLLLTGAYLWANGLVGGATAAVATVGAGVEQRVMRVGFLPVTCHLTCPVTDWINQNTRGKSTFEPVRFSGWPELKEAFLAGELPASFMIAPMAIKLVEQGVPLKIVYLGHRDGTALVVHKDSDIKDFGQLRGKRIAVPSRFSNQYLLIARALESRGMTLADVTIVEMPPPDMPAALSAKAVDAVISGEPFMGQTELEGYGRVLAQAKDLWPDFISCVLVVEQKLIDEEPARVQELVDGIASSGKWLDQDMAHRMEASEEVAKNYYHQDPKLLRFVLSKPPDRVRYTNLDLVKADFDEIVRVAVKAGIMTAPLPYARYADPQFSAAVHVSPVTVTEAAP